MAESRVNNTHSCPSGTTRVSIPGSKSACISIQTADGAGFMIGDSTDIFPRLQWLLRAGSAVPLHQLEPDIASRQRIAAGGGPTAALAISELASGITWMDGLDRSIAAAMTSLPGTLGRPAPGLGTTAGPFLVGSLIVSLDDHALPGTPRRPSTTDAPVLRERLAALRVEVQGLRRQSVVVPSGGLSGGGIKP